MEWWYKSLLIKRDSQKAWEEQFSLPKSGVADLWKDQFPSPLHYLIFFSLQYPRQALITIHYINQLKIRLHATIPKPIKTQFWSIYTRDQNEIYFNSPVRFLFYRKIIRKLNNIQAKLCTFISKELTSKCSKPHAHDILP